MQTKFFNILIFLAVFFQGIAASFKENEQLSDTLLREKRVIHPSPTAAVPRYVASILKNGHRTCGSAILTTNIILTAAHCFNEPGEYFVFAGSNNINEATGHHIIHKEIHPHYNSHDFANNLALLIIAPNISLHVRSFNRDVTIYDGIIRSGPVAVLSGWGSNTLERPGIVYPLLVQSAHLRILTWEDCAAMFGNEYTHITKFEICTHDWEKLGRSGYGDVGSPLTVAGYLVGILSWSRVVVNSYTPDVYTNIALPVYREWINQFVRTYRH